MACNKDYDYKCDDCVDAWALSRLYSCYEAAHPVADLEFEVEVGDCVEANQGRERFWVQVTDVCVCYIIGIVISDLHFNHPFTKGSRIRLEIFHIYNVDKGCKRILS